jgi:NAD(P)-dependent dehydrogenase (short-subunit alcohol dehydrogenase family)
MTATAPLAGRVALVTGAGRGLGRAAAKSLAAAGADVALVARTQSELNSVSDEIQSLGRRAIAFPVDATQSGQVDAAVAKVAQHFGRIDILVHCVGRSMRKPSLSISDAEWDALISTNLSSTFFVCRAVGRLMVQQGKGSIVNIASAAGLRGRPTNAPYSAAKAAVINLSKALALEWAPHQVRVNVLAPGRFLTPLTQAEMSDPLKYETFIKQVPLGRIGQPEELKEIVVWLASDASSFVTGSVVVIDGGQTLL